MPEFIDSVFAQTSPKRSFSMMENERFGLVFANHGSINSSKRLLKILIIPSQIPVDGTWLNGKIRDLQG